MFAGEKGPVIQLIRRQTTAAKKGLSPKRMIHESEGDIDNDRAMAPDIPSQPKRIGDCTLPNGLNKALNFKMIERSIGLNGSEY